jgi:hypothetical protein
MVLNGFVFLALAALAAGQTIALDMGAKADPKPTPTVTAKVVHRAPTPVVAKPPEPPTVTALAVDPDPPRARRVKMADTDVVPIFCARQYETLFILQPNEHIIEAGVGDPDRWQARVADPKKPSSALHVKPAILGSRTNLNIRTDRGHTYTFALTECKGCAAPDMKVFIEPSGAASGTDTLTLPTPEEVALTSAVKDQGKMITDLRAALDEAAKDLAKFKVDSEKEHEQEIGKFRSRYALNHNCAYRFAIDQKPFFVKQICHDEAFTYIRVAGDTPPAVYGEQDGKLSLLPAKFERDEKEPRGGTLIVSAVIPRGRLAYGKEKMEFTNAAK